MNFLENKKEILNMLEKKLFISLNNILKDIPNKTKIGILFSGGVDSALIAYLIKKLGRNPICFTIGAKDSHDIKLAKEASKAINVKLITKEISKDDIILGVKRIIKITKTNDPVTNEIALSTMLACDLAKNNNINIIFSGLGVEEIFAGYRKHIDALKNDYDSVHKECIRGLKNIHKGDLYYTKLVANAVDINIKLPFLDTDFIEAGMKIHPKLKINNNKRKIIFRELAENLGLPHKFAWESKKAIQYGSKLNIILSKITKSKNTTKLKLFDKELNKSKSL